MRYLILLLGLSGCTWAGTSAEYDPETGKIAFERGWLGGPVDMEAEVTKPDGTVYRMKWKSDINLDAAQAVRLEEVKTVNRALETLEKAASAAGGGGG